VPAANESQSKVYLVADFVLGKMHGGEEEVSKICHQQGLGEARGP